MINMETTILNIKNCHRADKVRLISNPEYGEWKFEYKGQKIHDGFMRNEYAHVASKAGFGNATVIADTDREMNLWEVVSWKYEENLEDLWSLACRAFHGTSFSPEDRARLHIYMYEKTLQDDLKLIPSQEEKEKYTEKFREWVRALFDKHSRILSAMITGPARFSTARNEKAHNAYSKALEDFENWRSRAIKAINKRIEDGKPAEQKQQEEWENLKADIDWNIKSCVDIDNGAPYHRQAFTNSIYGKIERLAGNGKSELVMRAIEYVKQVQDENTAGLKKPLFTNRHKIWQLKDVCEKSIQKRKEEHDKGNDEIKFEGGVIVKNREEDRLQILFNEKPDAETISRLKHNGFRWSPRFKAWQRQLTTNACYACARVIPLTERLAI